MKVAYLFFLYLFFLLLGETYSYGSTHLPSSSSQALNTEETQKIGFVNTDQGFALIKNSSLKEEKEYIISIENEDEDLISTRKYVSLANYFTTLASTSNSVASCSYFKNLLPLYKHLSHCSYKYILQRVLRI